MWTPVVVFDRRKAFIKFITRLVYEPRWEELSMAVTAEKSGGVFTFRNPRADLLPGEYYPYLFAENQNRPVMANVNTTFVIVLI